MKYILLLILFPNLNAFSQNNNSVTDDKLKFFIGEQVINAEGENEKQIIQLWKNYISDGQ